MPKSGTIIDDRPVSSECLAGNELLTKAQFAKRVQVHLNTVNSWISKGTLIPGEHFIRIGRVVRILYGDSLIKRLLERSTKPAETPRKPGKKAKSFGSPRINLD